jgi:hypothetical protein
LSEDGIFKGAHLEHALRANHLSNHPSIRRGFIRYIDEVTIPQLARALANIEIGNSVKPKLDNVLSLSIVYRCNYEIGRIGSGLKPDERGIMGCQESLWQFQLSTVLLGNEQFIGRIGFNYYWENDNPIVSITNIQGIPGAKESLNFFEELNG